MERGGRHGWSGEFSVDFNVTWQYLNPVELRSISLSFSLANNRLSCGTVDNVQSNKYTKAIINARQRRDHWNRSRDDL